MNAWMIRAGRGGTFATDWVENSIIGNGWDFDGLDIANMDRDQIRTAYAAAHPAESKQKVAASVGQVFRFAHSMEQGSTVVMYDPAERLYHIGVIAGPCSPVPEPEDITYTRVPSPGTKPLHAMRSRSLPRTRLAAFRPSSPSRPRSWPIWSRQPLISVRRRAPGSPATPTSQPKLPAMTHPVTTRRSPPPTTTASSSSRTA